MVLIGIAGGSGCGKSTLAYGLMDRYPELIEVIHFDDYYKKKEEVPVSFGMTNWDHPDAINFDKLIHDLKELANGYDVEIMTKSERHNPNYKTDGRIPYMMKARKILLVEGYLALHDARLREMYDYMIYLDLDYDERTSRRTKFIIPEYNSKILIPMHLQYVEPTKKFADFILDVSGKSREEVMDIIINKLKEANIL